MSDIKLPEVIEYWKNQLQIQHYQIRCERIATHQVCGDFGKRGHEFVGICTNHANCSAHLFHTRKLKMDDIVHELLHVKYPKWSENQINQETERILMQEKNGREVISCL